MPKQRIKDGNVIEDHATRQPTAEEAEKQKQKRIASEKESRDKLEKSRKQSAPSSEAPATKPAGTGAGNNSKTADK